MNSKKIEILVGFFVSLGIAAIVMLALKVANAGMSGNGDSYVSDEAMLVEDPESIIQISSSFIYLIYASAIEIN